MVPAFWSVLHKGDFMRQDMTKVFHEPGRQKSGWNKRNGTKCSAQRHGLESIPNHEPIRRDWDSGSAESYGPVRRYLLSCVGRLWNDVYSEICQSVKVNNLPGYNLHQVIDRMVAKHVHMIKGEAYDDGGARVSGSYRPVWVHPDTGILMGSPKPVYKNTAYRSTRVNEQVEIDPLHKLVKIKDLWFEVTFAPLPEPKIVSAAAEGALKTLADPLPRDIVMDWIASNQKTTAKKFVSEWGAEIYAVSKQQAGKRTIKRYLKAA